MTSEQLKKQKRKKRKKKKKEEATGTEIGSGVTGQDRTAGDEFEATN